jgi:hypothetical protein
MTTVNSEGMANANVLRQHFEQRNLEPSTLSIPSSNGNSVIIVGAGAFGSSLALD